MPVEPKWPSGTAGLLLLQPEDLPALFVKHCLGHKIIDGCAGLKSGIQLDERLRPQEARFELLFHQRVNSCVTDLNEAADVRGIVRCENIPQTENVHAPYPVGRARCFVAIVSVTFAPFEVKNLSRD